MINEEEDYASEDYEDTTISESEDESDFEVNPVEKNIRNIFGGILIFCFLSILTIFISSVIIVTTNNYMILTMYDITDDFVSSGTIPASYLQIAEDMANNYPLIINYLDMMWLSAFIGMVISSIGYAYYAKRENYFSLLSMIVLGILILSFLGGIFLQITTWFRTEFMSVFPSILPQMPMFNFYLNNVGVINLLLISIVILINFVDLDLSKFNDRKNKDSDSEI